MPWYYAGPDAKPVGPTALEELQARRLSGVVSPETYVIEYIGQPGDVRTWKRYRELFPAIPNLPAPPPPPSLSAVPPPPPPQPHPLFPSAVYSPNDHRGHNPAPAKTNPWCLWGFGLSLASLILVLPSCGLTLFLALPSLVISIIGLVKVHSAHTQAGRNLALSGLLLSAATILIAGLAWGIAIPFILKGHGQITTTEQSTNDSE